MLNEPLDYKDLDFGFHEERAELPYEDSSEVLLRVAQYIKESGDFYNKPVGIDALCIEDSKHRFVMRYKNIAYTIENIKRSYLKKRRKLRGKRI